MTPRASALGSTLGIRHPIIQSGMSRVAGPELVAAVSNAGRLGILAALRLQPEELRAQIRRIRELTAAPFGVNLWLHPAVVAPTSPESIDPQALGGAQQRLNEIRARLGLNSSTEIPSRFPKLVTENFDVILEYGTAPVLPPMLQSNAADDIFKAAAARGDAQYFPMPAGESAGLIADMPSAADVVRAIVREANEIVREFTPGD